MQLLSKPSSQFPFLFLSDLLPPPAKTRLSPANLAVILTGILFSAAAVIWFAIPSIFKLLSSIPRSSAAPRYLFIAVNFIIFAVWKLSETRPSVNEIGSIHGESVGVGGYLSRSALVSKKNLDHDVVSVDSQDLGASDTDRDESCSIHGDSVVLEHYIEKPNSIADVSGVYLSRSALISKKNLDYEVISVDRQDMGASDTDRNEIDSIHGESVVLEHYIEKPISIADSSSSSFSSGVSVLQSALIRKKNSDQGVVHLRRQDPGYIHTDRNEIPSIHEEIAALDYYIEKPMSIAASFLSSFSSVLSVLQSALLPKKSSDHEALHHRRQDLGSSHTDRNEITSIHEEFATLDHYIEKPISIASSSSSSMSSVVSVLQPSLISKKDSDHDVVLHRRQDLGYIHTDRNEIASIHEEISTSEHYIEPALDVIKPISIAASSSSLIPKKTLDHEVVSLDCPDMRSSHTDLYEIASIHEQNVTLDHYYTEKPIATAAATSTSSFTSALSVNNGEMEEENSLESTWNSIMRKTAGTKTGGGVSAGMRREGNARSEGDDDEINRRFEEFIKRSYDQIRLRKPGEVN